MTEPMKTPAQILNEHTPLGKGYHSSWIIPAMEAYASLKVAQERERIRNELRLLWMELYGVNSKYAPRITKLIDSL